MIDRLQRIALFAVYQLTVVLGITALPVALLLRRFGLRFPFHKAVQNAERAYETC